MAQGNRWVFTINFDTVIEEEQAAVVLPDYRPPWIPGQMTVMAWQWERAPSTGRLHIQGYVRFVKRKRMQTVKNLFDRENMHLELAKSAEKTCIDYCTKEESRVAEGEQHGEVDEAAGIQGRRTDLETAADEIRGGAQMRDVAIAHPATFIRYQCGLYAFQAAVRTPPPAQRDVTVTVLWGETGTGKTHRVMTMYPDIYTVSAGRGPWDGYNDHPRILIDEFLDSQWPITTMNRILDKWRYELDCRYRNKFAVWTEVFICSNSPPMSWYTNEPPMLQAALRRRISGRCFNIKDQAQALSEPDPLP